LFTNEVAESVQMRHGRRCGSCHIEPLYVGTELDSDDNGYAGTMPLSLLLSFRANSETDVYA